ncbi:MAG: 50S ribosomal protein L32 [Chlamydiae bacterium]|nr:50S ribosomal protein L32 [Chlamydiota bacterium]
MAVPRNRTSNSKKNKRRSHHAKVPTNLVSCSNCQSMKKPHAICDACGYYKGRNYIANDRE